MGQNDQNVNYNCGDKNGSDILDAFFVFSARQKTLPLFWLLDLSTHRSGSHCSDCLMWLLLFELLIVLIVDCSNCLRMELIGHCSDRLHIALLEHYCDCLFNVLIVLFLRIFLCFHFIYLLYISGLAPQYLPCLPFISLTLCCVLWIFLWFFAFWSQLICSLISLLFFALHCVLLVCYLR